jgi:hypothetical protein
MALAAIVGMVAGVLGLQGWSGFLALGAAMAAVHGYVTGFLEADAEDFGGGLATEGLMPALGIFLLAWTLVSALLWT